MLARLQDRMKEVMEKGFALFEIDWVTKGGALIPVEISARRINFAGRPAILSVARDVAERKRNEETLIENEENSARSPISPMTGSIGMLDSHMIYCSPSCERISGYSSKELFNNPALLIEMVYAEDKPLSSEHFGKEMRIGSRETDLRIVTPKGDICWISHACQAVFDDMGKYLGRRVSNRDITERKRTEKTAIESEHQYRQLMEKANDAILIHEISPEGPGRLIEVNNRACQMLGYSRDELLQKCIPDLDVPEQKDNMRAITDKLYFSKTALFRTDLLSNGGRRIPVEVSSNLIDFQGREVILAIVRDITESNRAEKALQVSRKELANIIDFLPDATLVVDLEGRIVAWNQAIEKMTGVSKKDMIGQGDHTYSVPFYGTNRGMLLDLLTMDDEKLKREYDYVTREGDILFAETFCSALNGRGGAHV